MNQYLFFGLIFLFVSCSKNKTESSIVESNLSGKELSKIHCGSCHLEPNPKLLTTEVWSQSVLPQMAMYMGIQDPFASIATLPPLEIKALLENGVYPGQPLIHENDFKKIADFILKNAPENLKVQSNNYESLDGFFKVKHLNFDSKEIISINKIKDSLYFSSGDIGGVFDFNENKIWPGKFILDMDYHLRDGTVLLEAGEMNPHEVPSGKLVTSRNKLIADKLHRPVQFEISDWDQDGIQDYLVSCFGNHSGELLLINGKTKEKKPILSMAGIRNVIIEDVNKDGNPDAFVLSTQAREGVSLILNKGNSQIEILELLKFPPVFGSSFLELEDINNDGLKDLIVSMGDNADLSRITKPYHGLRIYINKGNFKFERKYFISIPGLTKSLSFDYDNDGDVDVAAICYFRDNGKSPSFVYFENKKGVFVSKIITSLNESRWLTMEKIDFNKDGKMDIALGGFNRGGEQKNKKSICILLNKR